MCLCGCLPFRSMQQKGRGTEQGLQASFAPLNHSLIAAGLDTDKLDYLVRDQLFIFTQSRHPLGLLDLKEFMYQASLVRTNAGEDGPAYEIAYKLAPDCFQVSFNSIFSCPGPSLVLVLYSLASSQPSYRSAPADDCSCIPDAGNDAQPGLPDRVRPILITPLLVKNKSVSAAKY
jgi:hypothetical protein